MFSLFLNQLKLSEHLTDEDKNLISELEFRDELLSKREESLERIEESQNKREKFINEKLQNQTTKNYLRLQSYFLNEIHFELF